MGDDEKKSKMNMGNNVSVDISDKLTAKDIYNELFRCRDFELEHLWQRSVFLGTFMLAILAGYGTWVITFVGKLCDFVVSEKGTSCLSLIFKSGDQTIFNMDMFSLFHIISLFISLIGIVAGQLWIMMAKGSKFWTDSLEKSIFYISERMNSDSAYKPSLADILTDEKFILYLRENVRHEPENKRFPTYGNLISIIGNKSLASTQGARYSVSRINIFLGMIFTSLWCVAGSFHIFVLSDTPKDNFLCILATLILSFLFICSFCFFSNQIISCHIYGGRK